MNEEDKAQEVLEEAAAADAEATDAAVDFETAYQDILDRYQRTLAEFDNFRKRTVKEKASRYDDGIRAMAEKLLPVSDNFERALKTGENPDGAFYQGMVMVARQLDTLLTDFKIEAIPAVGAPFDPNLHFAVAHVADEAYGAGEVIEEMQKGYKHKDRVIRPSMVKVAN